MNINFEYYKVFYNVAKNKNITKAADELMISQPAVSRSIKNLEEQIGCNLFTRGKTGVNLTEEGKTLYNEIKNAIEIIENAELKINEMIDLDFGILNIGISNTLTKHYLLPYIKSFTSKYPKVNIKIHTGTSPELVNKARAGLVDLIFINFPSNIPNDFKQTKLEDIHDMFVAKTSEFKQLKDKTLKLEELNNYPIVLLAQGSNGRYFIDNFCNEVGVTLNPKFELASYYLVTEFINQGIGIGLLTKEFIKDKLENNELFEIKTTPSIPAGNRYIGIIYLNNKVFSHCAKEFLKLLNNAKKEF